MRNLKVGFILSFFEIEHLFMIFAKYFEILIKYKAFQIWDECPKKKGLKKLPESVLCIETNSI